MGVGASSLLGVMGVGASFLLGVMGIGASFLLGDDLVLPPAIVLLLRS
jgi:hypothetical protein